MGSTRLEDLTPDTADRVRALIQKAEDAGIGIQIVSTRRTCADQESIYAQGRTTPGAILTHARGCQSWHVWGRAVDVLAINGKGKAVTNANDPIYDVLGPIGESLGMVWGGRFSWGKDAGHFEFHPGVTISQACPDPSSCDWAIQQPWMGPDVPSDVPAPASPSTEDVQDVSDTSIQGPSGSSAGLAVLAGAATVAAGYLAVQAFRHLRKRAA